MVYLEDNNLGVIFGVIYENYAKAEEVPHYEDEAFGIDKLKGVFNGVKMDEFYPSLLDKAVYLFLQINKGHFFSNGNKRLSLVCTLVFVLLNELKANEISSKEEYKEKLKELFPKYSRYEDQDDFSSPEFGLYNLSVLVADSQKYVDDFNLLKEKTKKFFEFTLIQH